MPQLLRLPLLTHRLHTLLIYAGCLPDGLRTSGRNITGISQPICPTGPPNPTLHGPLADSVPELATAAVAAGAAGTGTRPVLLR